MAVRCSASLDGVKLLVAKFSSGLCKLADDFAEDGRYRSYPSRVLKEEWLKWLDKGKQVFASVGRCFDV
jgi:hypothetical protein